MAPLCLNSSRSRELGPPAADTPFLGGAGCAPHRAGLCPVSDCWSHTPVWISSPAHRPLGSWRAVSGPRASRWLVPPVRPEHPLPGEAVPVSPPCACVAASPPGLCVQASLRTSASPPGPCVCVSSGAPPWHAPVPGRRSPSERKPRVPGPPRRPIWFRRPMRGLQGTSWPPGPRAESPASNCTA